MIDLGSLAVGFIVGVVIGQAYRVWTNLGRDDNDDDT